MLCLNAEEENVILLRYYQQICIRGLHWERKSHGSSLNFAPSGSGQSETHTLREWAVMVRNPARAGLRKQSRTGLYLEVKT